MKSVILKSGKKIEVETINGVVEVFGRIMKINYVDGKPCLSGKGSEEMSNYFGVNVTGKWVNLEVSSRVLSELNMDCYNAKRNMPKDNSMSRSELKNLMSGSGKMDFEN